MESKLGYSALRDGYSPTGDEDDDDDTPGALSEAPGTATSRLRLLSSTSSGSVGEGACCSRTSSSGVAPCGMNRRARNEETNATSMALAVSLWFLRLVPTQTVQWKVYWLYKARMTGSRRLLEILVRRLSLAMLARVICLIVAVRDRLFLTLPWKGTNCL